MKFRCLSVLVIALGICGCQSQALVGRYIWGHEVRSFAPCGTAKAYWVVGPETVLAPLRAQSDALRLKESTPYPPLYLEAVGTIDVNGPRDGFAEQYDGIVKLSKVVRVSEDIPNRCEPGS